MSKRNREKTALYAAEKYLPAIHTPRDLRALPAEAIPALCAEIRETLVETVTKNGGHLASTVATQTKGDERPAFQILFYPVITMDASYTHSGSRQNLIGSNGAPSLVRQYSSEKRVTEETPMAYLCWADDDNIVSARNSREYITALNNKKPENCIAVLRLSA